MGETIPLSQRRFDWLIIAFFIINLGFITYIVDLEQLVIPDPNHFVYPFWPPAPLIDLVHAYARHFDPLVLARPVWWKVTIWFDALGFGPFYAVGLYAYIRGKEWIRLPSIIYGTALFTIVTIILAEETFGPSQAPYLWVVYLDNAPWLLMPIAIIARMYLREHPFTRPEVERSPSEPSALPAAAVLHAIPADDV
ncbi:MAG: EXPERA domain-containing protein [Ktedonobacteraceae bacterium]|jgi:hypothetical protein